MRSTFDLPDELMRDAEVAAVERGVTLPEGLRRVLADKPPTRRRGRLSNIRIAEDAPVLRMSIADLKALENRNEAERLAAIQRRR